MFNAAHFNPLLQALGVTMIRYIAPTHRLEQIEARLWNAPTFPPFSGRKWWEPVPNRPGIYALWNRRDNPVYVGESRNLRVRLKQLGSPEYHTFPAKIQQRNEHLHTAKDVREFIRTHYTISCIAVTFGRTEAEEYLLTAWRTYIKARFNSPIPGRWRCDT